jgi:hypothetical protein
MNGSGRYSIAAQLEAYGPLVSGATTFLVLALLRHHVLDLVVGKTISMENLYNSVFGWAAIQTGCLFAIYGYVAGKTDGFIGEIRQSRSMRRYNVYLWRATLIGFVLTVSCVPLIVWNYEVTKDDLSWFFIVNFWFSLFVWTFVSFIRVAYIFGVLIKVGEPTAVAG